MSQGIPWMINKLNWFPANHQYSALRYSNKPLGISGSVVNLKWAVMAQ